MPFNDYSIIVFSFNRGVHLLNCVTSIERHAPDVQVHIFDDDSRDPETIDVLRRLSARHTVTIGGARLSTGSKVGGLYVNMQQALDELPDNHLFSLFQDDMQMVRDLEPDDLTDMHRYFDYSERNAFLGHVFMRGYRREGTGPLLHYEEQTKTYYREVTETGGGSHFGAVHTSRTDRLRAVSFRYAPSEKLNDVRAKALFSPMAGLRDPFAACLPAVPVHRFGMNTYCQRLAGRLSAEGLYPVVPLSTEQLAALRQRDPEARIPWSEDFLVTDPPAPEVPWTYSGFQGRRWLKHLNRAEVAIRRQFRRRD